MGWPARRWASLLAVVALAVPGAVAAQSLTDDFRERLGPVYQDDGAGSAAVGGTGAAGTATDPGDSPFPQPELGDPSGDQAGDTADGDGDGDATSAGARERAGAPAPPAPPEGPNASTTTAGDGLIRPDMRRLDMMLGGESYGEAVRSFRDIGRTWLSLSDLAAIEAFNMGVVPALGYAGGDPATAAPFHIAWTERAFVRAGEPDQYPAEDIRVLDDAPFVTATLAEELMGRTVTVSYPVGEIVVSAEAAPGDPPRPGLRPPAQQRVRATVRGESQLQIVSDAARAPEPAGQTGFAVAETRTAGWQTRALISGRMGTGRPTRDGVGAAFLDDSELDTVSLTAGRTFDSGDGAADLVPMEEIAIGDVAPVNGPVGASSALERGVRVDGTPRHRPADFRNVAFTGTVEPGSAVLVTRNYRLAGQDQAGLDGRYAVTDVPLAAGVNRLRRYGLGPDGDLDVRDRTVVMGEQLLLPGEGQYRFSATQTATPLVTLASSARGDSLTLPGAASREPPTAAGPHFSAGTEVGIAPGLALEGEAQVADPGGDDGVAGLGTGVLALAGPGIADVRLRYGPDDRTGVGGGYRLAAGPWTVSFRQKAFTSTAAAAPYGPARDGQEWVTELRTGWAAEDANRGLGAGARLRRHSRLGGDATTWRLGADGGAQVGPFYGGLASDLVYRTGSAADPDGFASESDLALAINSDLVRSLTIGSLDFTASGGLGLESATVYGQLDVPIAAALRAGPLVRVAYPDRPWIETGLRAAVHPKSGPGAAALLSVTEQGAVRAGVSLRWRLGGGVRGNRLALGGKPELDRGAARARVRLRERTARRGESDSASQAAAQPVAGARVSAAGTGRSAVTNDDGRALLTKLPPDQAVRLRVDEQTLEFPERRVVRPDHVDQPVATGVVPEAQFDVRSDGAIAGQVRISDGTAAYPAPGLSVGVRRPGGERLIAVTATGADGSFRLDELAPGPYVVGLWPAEIDALGLREALTRRVAIDRPGGQVRDVVLTLGFGEAPELGGGAGAGEDTGSASGAESGAGDGASGGDRYVAFLGAFPETEQVLATWFGLAQRFSDVVRDVAPLDSAEVEAAAGAEAVADIEQNPLFVGTFATQSAAEEFCRALAERDQFCEVRGGS